MQTVQCKCRIQIENAAAAWEVTLSARGYQENRFVESNK